MIEKHPKISALRLCCRIGNSITFCIYFDEATDGYTVGGHHMTKGSYGYNQPGKNLRVND